MWYQTEEVLLSAGIGHGGSSLNAFDNALRDAKIADFNLLKVSSIVPAGVPVTKLSANCSCIAGDGRLVPAVYEEISSDNEGTAIAAGVGLSLLTDRSQPGLIFTYSGFTTRKKVEEILSDMVMEGMREKGAEKKDFSLFISASSCVVSSMFSCAVAAAVFCDSDILSIVNASQRDK